eukprot:1684578-Prymnesium_polylepis.1
MARRARVAIAAKWQAERMAPRHFARRGTAPRRGTCSAAARGDVPWVRRGRLAPGERLGGTDDARVRARPCARVRARAVGRCAAARPLARATSRERKPERLAAPSEARHRQGATPPPPPCRCRRRRRRR